MIEIVQGDARRIIVPVVTNKGVSLNVSGAHRIEFAVARTYGATIQIEKSLSAGTVVITGSNDEVYFDIESSDTVNMQPAQYVIEGLVVTSTGLPYTIYQIPFKIKPRVITL